VVDHKDQTRDVLDELITSWGAKVTTATSGEKALQLMRRNPRPDLVICDHDLPDMNGDAICEAMRDDELLNERPLIILASPSKITEPRRDGGRTAFVSKPYRIEPLVRAVSEAMIAAGAEQARRLAEAGRVDKNGKLIGREPEAMEPDAGNSSIRILIAEDNRVNQMVVTSMIGEMGYAIEMADNGKSAVEKFVSDKPDLVIMDVSMPEMDGLEATRAIRAYERENSFGRVPIIAATAHAMEEDKKRCREAGMDDYIAKPIRQRDILEKIRYWIASDAA
jgi:CheY-like chemotaxis protein